MHNSLSVGICLFDTNLMHWGFQQEALNELVSPW